MILVRQLQFVNVNFRLHVFVGAIATEKFYLQSFSRQTKAITAVSKKLLWILLVALFNSYSRVCCLSGMDSPGCVTWTVAGSSSSWEGDQHSQVFLTRAEFCECHWNTLWQFLAGSFACRWTLGFSRHLKPIVSGWSCRGEGRLWGQLHGAGCEESLEWGKEVDD